MAKKKNNSSSNNNNEVEKKEEEKSKGSDGGGKKEEKGPVPVVLKVEMHCEGCVSKIVKSVRAFEGVETVKAEPSSNKLTVTGKIDPLKVTDYLHLKTKKQVDLISPQPQKQDSNKNNNSSSNKEDKKSNDKKPDSAAKPKEATVSTAVLKLGLHCQGCIKKIQKIVLKTKGVQEIGIDTKTELVTVKGTMDVKALAETLKERLKRPVDIVPPKKEKEGGKEADNAAEGGGGKKKGGGGNGGGGNGGGHDAAAAAAAKLEEINRMEFTVQPGLGYMDQPIYGNGYVGQPVYASHGPDYGYGYGFGHAPQQGYGFGHAPHQGYRPVQAYPDHLQFNDENPNACSIM